MSDQLFWQLLEQAATKAESAGSYSNFGKLSIKPHRFIHWEDNTPVEVSPEVYSAISEKEKSLEIMLSVDFAETNPALEFNYERFVRIGGPDWHKILRPSLEAILGKGALSAGKYAQTFQDINGKFVEVVDVPNVKGNANDEGRVYGTVKVVKIYNSLAECVADRDERFGKQEVSPAAVMADASSAPAELQIPSNYDKDSWMSCVPSIKAASATKSLPEIATDYAVGVNYIAQVLALP